ncbi:MAG: hypothetical protein ACLSTO_05600 [Bilophila wadsworthia]
MPRAARKPYAKGLKFAVQQIRTLLDNGAGHPPAHMNKAPMCLRIAEEMGAL